ncbi:MAG: hypothetical protein QM756_20005 [Polyangiaceae bacterium]
MKLVTILFLCLFASACHREHFTDRAVLGVTGGGAGESWVVVNEVEGVEGRDHADKNRFVVYQCLPSGCKAISALLGSERTRR